MPRSQGPGLRHEVSEQLTSCLPGWHWEQVGSFPAPTHAATQQVPVGTCFLHTRPLNEPPRLLQESAEPVWAHACACVLWACAHMNICMSVRVWVVSSCVHTCAMATCSSLKATYCRGIKSEGRKSSHHPDTASRDQCRGRGNRWHSSPPSQPFWNIPQQEQLLGSLASASAPVFPEHTEFTQANSTGLQDLPGA